MKMPSRAMFGDAPELFLHEMNRWFAASEAAYQFVRGLYEATPEWDAKPDWIDQAENVSNVSMPAAGFDESALEPCLRNLSGSVMDRGMKVVRLCHGKLHEDGNDLYVIFVETAAA
jgi:hypothetical protein